MLFIPNESQAIILKGLKEKDGIIFSIARDNEPVIGCTVSRLIFESKDFGINYFSMACDTDISAESYSYQKIIFNVRGEFVIYYGNKKNFF